MAETIDFKAFFEEYEFPFRVDRCENGWYCLSIPLFHSDGDGVKYIEKRDEIAATATEENFAYTLWQMVSVILAVDVTAHALAKWHVMEAAKHGSGGKTEGADKGTN